MMRMDWSTSYEAHELQLSTGHVSKDHSAAIAAASEAWTFTLEAAQ